jgi:uncharacterized protein (TIGR03435 family)
MKLLIRFLWGLTVVTVIASAQHAGDIPPALVWSKLKGSCQDTLDWADLHGRVVVVSLSPNFFPTDVDDWKQAAKPFEGGHIQFIRVVGGSEFLLDQALKQNDYHGCVLFDADLQNQKNFKLPARFARTVVVDQLGVIVGYARGGDDIKDAVRSVLDNRPSRGLDETPPQPQHYEPTAGLDQAPYGVHISPAQVGELRALGTGGPDRYISRNQPLQFIILDLWNTSSARIAFPERLTEGNYDVTAIIPGVVGEMLLQFVRDAVERQFGLVVEKETRVEKVYLLSALQNRSPQLQPAINSETSMSGGSDSSIVGTAQTMQDIARVFEGLLNTPVIDSTDLKGKYNYSASNKLSGTESALDLAHQLGLELTEAMKPIEMLVVQQPK